MNAISEHGTGWLLKHGCQVGPDVENPDGMLSRSANLHGMEFGENMIAIARAGAGFNNIPVEECAFCECTGSGRLAAAAQKQR